jgi:hypothetical protein
VGCEGEERQGVGEWRRDEDYLPSVSWLSREEWERGG